MIGDIITNLLFILIQIVTFLLTIIFSPIDILLEQFVPIIPQGFDIIAQYLVLLASSLGFAISLTGITFFALLMIVALTIARLTIPLTVWVLKLIIQWKKAIK